MEKVKKILQAVSDPVILSSGIKLYVLRLDMIHPHISGNKWYKLKYNLQEAKKRNKKTLLTFGGAYSNHIAATAAAGKEFGFETIGIIRGTPPLPSPKGRGKYKHSPTLRFAESCGMQLHFVSRKEYQGKDSDEFIKKLQNQFSSFYLLPEGGTNNLAVKGCSEITGLIDIPFDYICCPAGTGGTLAGIISSLKKNQKALGFSVLKGGEFLKKIVQNLVTSTADSCAPNLKVDINTEYHFGGYAKHTPELLKFINYFEKQNNIPLEHVYTGKMMYGIYDLIKKNHFSAHSTIVAVHTGGLQGKLH